MQMYKGVVVDNNDNTLGGRVQVSVPGLFDDQHMSKESLPWIEPFVSSGYQRFSKLKPGSKVWVINNTESSEEYYYMPIPEMTGAALEIVSKNYDSDPEMMFCQDLGNGQIAASSFNKNDGIVNEVGEASLQVAPDGAIVASNDTCKMLVEKDCVTIGYNGEDSKETPMVKGDDLVSILSNLQSSFYKLAKTCSTCSSVKDLLEPITSCADSLNDINNILSNSAYISDK